MRNADFYEVTAQVTPTIFIAVVLELRALLGHTSERWQAAATEHTGGPAERKLFGQYATAAMLFIILSAGFVISELAALSVVLLGVAGLWPKIAVCLVVAGLALLTLAAFAMPIWHEHIRSKANNARQFHSS